jgi:signal transduction histidine kinase/FixJ family two-component response regulator/HPt (histidine-containing phosphotransfer) domain-containing protein
MPAGEPRTMTRALEPAVALMSRLRYPQKFALISMLFGIPIALMMYLWLAELSSQLAFAKKERDGLQYVVALRRVIEPLDRSRGLRLLAESGDLAARQRLAQERGKVAAAAVAVDAVNARLGDTLGVSQVWQALRPRITHPSVEPGLLATEAQRLIEQVADASRLSLDPDLASYYLMDATVNRLPALAHHLGTIDAGEIERRLTRAPTFSSPAVLLAVLGQAQAERDALDRGHLVAFRANPALRPRLESRLAHSWRAVDVVGAMVEGETPETQAAVANPLTPGAVDQSYAVAIAAIFAHHDAVAAALDDLLRARMSGIVAKRRLLLLIVAVAMLTVAYLWVGFYAAVTRAVTALERVSARMLTGEFTGPVVVETRDELHRVVDSFNRVAARLRTEWQRAQDESSRARAAEASLATARDAAEAATRAKSKFLAVMSHEIRTPMNGILGMAHLLLEMPLGAPQRHYATTIRDSGQALLTILNDILDFSKIEAGKLELESADFDPTDVVASVIGLLAPRARDKGIDLRGAVGTDVPRARRGDAGRLRQVLLNLVGNAVKFTDRGSVRLEVGLAGAIAERALLRFQIIDTGPGIAPEAQQRLFRDFTQVDPLATRRAAGTGLGLAICRTIVEAMGGEIGVESAVGRGSAFWFTVWLEPAAGEVPREAPQAEVTVRPLTILLAEDNPVNQQVAVGLLTRRGHRVDVVGNGREAVHAVRVGRYDVVLMDVNMPEMDGIEAAREIRQLPGDRGQLPIIALSASAMQEEIDQCLAAGMVTHLPKPIDPVALASVLSRCADADRGCAAPAERAAAGVDQGYVQLLLESLGAAKVGELIGDLRRHAEPERDRLLRARAHDDLAEMRAAAHALTGMAANLGLTALAELTAAIEEACRHGRAGEVGSLCDRLDASLDQALTELDALRPEGSSSA